MVLTHSPVPTAAISWTAEAWTDSCCKNTRSLHFEMTNPLLVYVNVLAKTILKYPPKSRFGSALKYTDILIQICKKSLLLSYDWQGLPNHWTLKPSPPGRRLCIALNLPNGLSRNFFRLTWSLNPKKTTLKRIEIKHLLFQLRGLLGKGNHIWRQWAWRGENLFKRWKEKALSNCPVVPISKRSTGNCRTTREGLDLAVLEHCL